MAEIDLVLFDLGGVLIEFGGVTTMRELAGLADDDEVWRRWLSCPWVRSFERGRCSADDFAAGVVADWALPISEAEFLALFTDWVRGPYPGAAELVTDVHKVVPVGCLSNTNALHWEQHRWRIDFLDELDPRFLSFELGLLKPDRDLFERIAELVPVPPDRVLFLDDNEINVDCAAAVGFRATRARGVDEARIALVEAGVLAPV